MLVRMLSPDGSADCYKDLSTAIRWCEDHAGWSYRYLDAGDVHHLAATYPRPVTDDPADHGGIDLPPEPS